MQLSVLVIMKVLANNTQEKPQPSNCWLRGMLVQMAAAVRCKQSYFAVVYPPIAARRRGHKWAIFAVAHRLQIAVYHMLRQHQPYRDYQATAPGRHSKEQHLQQLQRRIEQLSYQVQLAPSLLLIYAISLGFSKHV